MTLSEQFISLGLDDIDRFVEAGQVEHLTLDFKLLSSADLSRRDDRKNLAKAISGFANSDGGIVVWGVDASPNDDRVDCAHAKRPIPAIAGLESRLNQLTAEAVSPLVEGVCHRILALPDGSGFGLTLVPRSDVGPHMAKLGEDRYYKRSGDSFRKMEHFDIADMFGRRPQPSLELAHAPYANQVATRGELITIDLRTRIGITNNGKAAAHFPFLSVETVSPLRIVSDRFGLDGNGSHGMKRQATHCDASTYGEFAGGRDLVIYPRQTLWATLLVVENPIKCGHQPPITYEFRVRLAADGVPLIDREVSLPMDEVLQQVLPNE